MIQCLGMQLGFKIHVLYIYFPKSFYDPNC